MGRLNRQPAHKELLRLIVDYDTAGDFVADYDANLKSSMARIETTRVVAIGTIIEVSFAFPGLLQPIVVDALVQNIHEHALTIAFLEGGSAKLAQVCERVKARDPKLIAHVVNVLIVEDNRHVSELVRQGLTGTARRELRDVTF